MKKKILLLLFCPIILLSQNWQMISPSVSDFKSIPLTKPLVAFWAGNRSTDGGRTWKKIFLDSTRTPSSLLAYILNPPNTIYFRAPDGNIFKSIDLGVSFVQTMFPSMDQLVVSRNGDTLYGINHNVTIMGLREVTNRISIDSGMTWTSYTDVLYTKKPSDKLDFAFDTPMYFDARILKMNSVNGADVYFHLLRSQEVVSGTSWEIERFYKSTSAGKEGSFYSTFGKFTLNLDSFSRGKAIEVSPFTGDTLILETESEIIISNNRGEKWFSIFVDATKQLNTIAVDWCKDIIYSGSGDQAKHPGVWSSSDFGNTWVSMNQGFLNTLDIKVLHLDWEGNLYATKNDGLYVWNSVTEVENKNNLINDFTLSQNYPNPFSESTRIRFQICDDRLQQSEIRKQESEITFKVYDLLGREVLDLSDKLIDNFKLTIDNSQLPTPGVYFYRLTTPTFTQTKAMVMMR